jgi:hypothetical protein
LYYDAVPAKPSLFNQNKRGSSSSSSEIKISLVDDEDDILLLQPAFLDLSDDVPQTSSPKVSPKKLKVKFTSSATPATAAAASSPYLEPLRLAEAPNQTDLSLTMDMDGDLDDPCPIGSSQDGVAATSAATSLKLASGPASSSEDTKPTSRLKRYGDVDGIKDDAFSQERIAQELEEMLAVPNESEEADDVDQSFEKTSLDKLLGTDAPKPRKKRSPVSSTSRKRKRSDTKATENDSDDMYDSDDFEEPKVPPKSKRQRRTLDDFFDDAAMEVDGDDDDDGSLLDAEEEDDDLIEDDFMKAPNAKYAFWTNMSGFVFIF